MPADYIERIVPGYPARRKSCIICPQSYEGKVSDIFISYASQDRPKAQALAQALAQHGWTVWWDRSIPSGARFEQVIANALASARCVLVLWSKAALASDWVIEEAEEARKRQVLVPLLIENVYPPMGFRRIQAADLVGWDGASTAAQFRKLIADVEAVLGPPGAAKTEPGSGNAPAVAQDTTAKNRFKMPLVVGAVGAIVLAGALLAFVPRPGPPGADVKVPSVLGMRLKEARSTLEGSGLRVDRVTFRRNAKAPAGTVVQQSLDAGTLVSKNAAVHLAVSE